MEEKEYVNGLFKEKTKNDSNSKSLANLLNILTKTVFGDANRFIFELLQNADDSPKEKGVANVEVELRLLDKYLIFSHTGKHFSKEDVKGISDVGSGDSGKTKDIEKTGYKGIGFKSIFGTCNQVHIYSNKFLFKFDKNYFIWKNSKEYPWQIIPIWVEKSELPTEILSELNLDNVNFIINISDRAKIKNEITEVFNDPRIVLFLRYVKSITFFDYNISLFKIERKENKNLKEIYVNEILDSIWLYKEFEVDVDEELHEKLQNLESVECPQKLKEATKTKITFAALIENKKIKEISDAVLYCYLPTKVNYSFPFLINADFITNAERTEFLENDWNKFLFNQIARNEFRWFAELAQQDEFKYQFTKLIKNKFPMPRTETIKKSYNDGLETAIAETRFIPSKDDQESLLKIDECIVDYTKFCEKFTTSVITNYCGEQYKVADCKIIDSKKLVSLGSKKFEIDDLCEVFSKEYFRLNSNSEEQGIQFYFDVINFLYSRSSEGENISWINQLKVATFLLDNKNQLNAPEFLYFPLKDVSEEIASIIDFRCINLKLYEYINKNSELQNWLEKLGVKEPSDIEIVRKSVIKMIELNTIDCNNALQIGKFIFRVSQKGELNDNDYNSLNKLKLLTDKGQLEIPKNCYLLDYYQPQLKIQGIFPEGLYVSNEYVENNLEVLQWKRFLTKIGVKEKIDVKVQQSGERNKLKRDNHNFKPYFDFIDSTDVYPSITKSYISSGQHGLRNIVIIDYLEHLHIYSFSKSFWHVIISNNWSTIYSQCKSSKYYTRLGDMPVISYFEYYIKHNKSIPANNGQCYKSTDIYSSSLKKLVGDYYPVVSDEIKFTKDQEDFLGIKTTISVEDCLNILSKLVNSRVDSNTIKQIESIYKHIIKSDLNESDRSKIQEVNDRKLLAADGTFQEASSLYCFGVKELLPPLDSNNFIKIPESIKGNELEKLCNLFGISIIKYNDLEFLPINVKDDKELFNIIRVKAKYFAAIEANISDNHQSLLLEKMKKKISASKFYKAESLSLVYFTESRKEIYRQNVESWFIPNSNSIYYVGKWRNPLTLYSLGNSLCPFLELNNRERELGLILQLSDDETREWFSSNGYKIVETNLEEEVMEELAEDNSVLEAKEIEIIDNMTSSNNNFQGFDEFEEFEEFSPEVKASEVNLKGIDVHERITSEIQKPSTSSEFAKIQDDKVRCDIGRWGEELVYRYLENELRDLKGDFNFQENELGFVFSKNTEQIEVTWMNKKQESYSEYDFVINENGKYKYIEVKSTPSETKNLVDISEKEWHFMLEGGENYSIYRVYNAGKKDFARIEIIKNPSEMIINRKILLNHVILKI